MAYIKEYLTSELKFSKAAENLKFFKTRFMIGIDKKETRILITEKGRNFKKERQFNVIYKGAIPEELEDFKKLLSWLKVTKNETE